MPVKSDIQKINDLIVPECEKYWLWCGPFVEDIYEITGGLNG